MGNAVSSNNNINAGDLNGSPHGTKKRAASKNEPIPVSHGRASTGSSSSHGFTITNVKFKHVPSAANMPVLGSDVEAKAGMVTLVQNQKYVPEITLSSMEHLFGVKEYIYSSELFESIATPSLYEVYLPIDPVDVIDPNVATMDRSKPFKSRLLEFGDIEGNAKPKKLSFNPICFYSRADNDSDAKSYQVRRYFIIVDNSNVVLFIGQINFLIITEQAFMNFEADTADNIWRQERLLNINDNEMSTFIDDPKLEEEYLNMKPIIIEKRRIMHIEANDGVTLSYRVFSECIGPPQCYVIQVPMLGASSECFDFTCEKLCRDPRSINNIALFLMERRTESSNYDSYAVMDIRTMVRHIRWTLKSKSPVILMGFANSSGLIVNYLHHADREPVSGIIIMNGTFGAKLDTFKHKNSFYLKSANIKQQRDTILLNKLSNGKLRKNKVMFTVSKKQASETVPFLPHNNSALPLSTLDENRKYRLYFDMLDDTLSITSNDYQSYMIGTKKKLRELTVPSLFLYSALPDEDNFEKEKIEKNLFPLISNIDNNSKTVFLDKYTFFELPLYSENYILDWIIKTFIPQSTHTLLEPIAKFYLEGANETDLITSGIINKTPALSRENSLIGTIINQDNDSEDEVEVNEGGGVKTGIDFSPLLKHIPVTQPVKYHLEGFEGVKLAFYKYTNKEKVDTNSSKSIELSLPSVSSSNSLHLLKQKKTSKQGQSIDSRMSSFKSMEKLNENQKPVIVVIGMFGNHLICDVLAQSLAKGGHLYSFYPRSTGESEGVKGQVKSFEHIYLDITTMLKYVRYIHGHHAPIFIASFGISCNWLVNYCGKPHAVPVSGYIFLSPGFGQAQLRNQDMEAPVTMNEFSMAVYKVSLGKIGKKSNMFKVNEKMRAKYNLIDPIYSCPKAISVEYARSLYIRNLEEGLLAIDKPIQIIFGDTDAMLNTDRTIALLEGIYFKTKDSRLVIEKCEHTNDIGTILRANHSLKFIQNITTLALSDLQNIDLLKLPDGTNMTHFTLKKMIGRGLMAKVYLSMQLNTKKHYAIKQMSIARAKKLDCIYSIDREIKLLQTISHPFIIHLFGAFKNSEFHYFVLEYMVGGELYTLMKKAGRFPESIARFYLAEIVVSLEYLHSKSIVYRDMKPENILIDQFGHIKLIDFGFSKQLVPEVSVVDESLTMYRTNTLCGSPNYFAPEMIENLSGYSFEIDLWALGVIAYEMFCGRKPFADGNMQTLFDNIMYKKVVWDEKIKISNKGIKLVEQLLAKDPKRRLHWTYCPKRGHSVDLMCGTNAVRSHGWFKGTDWEKILARNYTPPLIPSFVNEMDTGNFLLNQEPSAKSSTIISRESMLITRGVEQSHPPPDWKDF